MSNEEDRILGSIQDTLLIMADETLATRVSNQDADVNAMVEDSRDLQEGYLETGVPDHEGANAILHLQAQVGIEAGSKAALLTWKSMPMYQQRRVYQLFISDIYND